MEVSDQLVVLRDGRIEQEGSPREIYEAPANEFVMGFLGPVSRVDGDEVTVVVTRTHARSYGLEEGSTVWLTPADGAIVVPRMAAAV